MPSIQQANVQPSESVVLRSLEAIPINYRIKYGKSFFSIFNNIGRNYFLKKKYKQAINYLLIANKFRPKKTGCLKLLSESYYFLDDFDQAFNFAQKLIIFHPGNDIGFELCSNLFKKNINLKVKEDLFNVIEKFSVVEMVARASSITFPGWWTICAQYYSFYLNENFKKQLPEKSNSTKQKSRVFILVNNTKESKTSSHLAFLSNLMATYENNGIECYLLISPHPYPGLGKFGQIGLRKTDISDTELSKKVTCNILQLVGPPSREYRVESLFSLSKKGITLKDYLFETINRLNSYKITENDLIILPGGICGSTLMAALCSHIPARTFFMMFSGNNKFDEVVNIADYIIHPSANYNPISDRAVKSGFQKRQILHNVIAPRPFYWEEQGFSKFTPDEIKFLSRVKKVVNANFIITAALQLEKRIDKEFYKLLVDILNKNKNIYILMIGSTGKKMFKLFPRLKKYKEKFIFLEFAEHLFTLYKEIRNKNVVYIFPRICGSGRSNVYAAYAGIPIVLFRGNDAESQLPGNCFVDDVGTLMDKIYSIFSNQSIKKQMVDEILNDKIKREKVAEEFYLSIINEKLYPKHTTSPIRT